MKSLRWIYTAFLFCLSSLPGGAFAAAQDAAKSEFVAVEFDAEKREELDGVPVDEGNDTSHAILVWSIVLGSIASGLSIVGLVLWLIYRYEKKRTTELASVADELGMQFTPGADERLLPVLQQFRLFNQGHSRRMKNVMTAVTDQLTLTIFDYQYTTGGGNNSRTHSRTLVALESAAFQLPQFSVRPEGLGDKLAAKLGFQDIDFDQHPEFSSKFVLQAIDENATRRFFTPQLLDLFASRPELSVDAVPGLITYRESKRAKPEDIRDLLSDAYEFAHKLEENLAK
ncbi:MAG: hypothetical protein AAF664_22815 [Planctomycetota bacterium]